MFAPPTENQSCNLLELITQLQQQNVRLQELVVEQKARIEVLENEIIRLKKLNARPNIKPNSNPTDDNESGTPGGLGEDDTDNQSEDNSSCLSPHQLIFS